MSVEKFQSSGKRRKHLMDQATCAEWFWSKVDRSAGPDACWPWTMNRNSRGYGTVKYELAGERRAYGAHVVAHVLTNGGPVTSKAQKTTILHACDNPSCCNPRHLSFGTVSENLRDAARKNRLNHRNHARGEAVGLARLSEADVREIRRRCAGGESQQALAHAFGMHRNNIGLIVNRQTWTHVQ